MDSRDMLTYFSNDIALYKRLLGDTNENIADCYYYKNRYFQAIPYYKKAINLQCESLGISIEQVQNGTTQDQLLGDYLYNYAFCYYKQKKDADGDDIMKMAALCGNQSAINFCKKYNISYQTKSSKLFE